MGPLLYVHTHMRDLTRVQEFPHTTCWGFLVDFSTTSAAATAEERERERERNVIMVGDVCSSTRVAKFKENNIVRLCGRNGKKGVFGTTHTHTCTHTSTASGVYAEYSLTHQKPDILGRRNGRARTHTHTERPGFRHKANAAKCSRRKMCPRIK